MTAAQWATFLAERADKRSAVTLWGNDCRELAALLRRAARVEEAAQAAVPAIFDALESDCCEYHCFPHDHVREPIEQHMVALRAALEEK